MMMPANYSAIAENEMTYVVGGGLLEAIGSVTAPVWGAANVKTFNTNLITIIGNSYVSKVLGATLGVMALGAPRTMMLQRHGATIRIRRSPSSARTRLCGMPWIPTAIRRPMASTSSCRVSALWLLSTLWAPAPPRATSLRAVMMSSATAASN